MMRTDLPKIVKKKTFLREAYIIIGAYHCTEPTSRYLGAVCCSKRIKKEFLA